MLKFPFLCNKHKQNKSLQQLFIDAHFRKTFPECFKFGPHDYKKFAFNYVEDEKTVEYLILEDDYENYQLKDLLSMSHCQELKTHLVSVIFKAKRKYYQKPCFCFSTADIDQKKLFESLVCLKSIVNLEFFFYLLAKINIDGFCENNDLWCYAKLIELLNDLDNIDHYKNFKHLIKPLFACNDCGDPNWIITYFHSRNPKSEPSYLYPKFFTDNLKFHQWSDRLSLRDIDVYCFKFLGEVKNNPWFICIEDHSKEINHTDIKVQNNMNVIRSALEFLNNKHGKAYDIKRLMKSSSEKYLASKLLMNVMPLDIHINLCTILDI